MLNNVKQALDTHIAFLKGRLARLVVKYGAKNVFELNMKTQFETKEEEVFANGLHHKLDAFTTIANIIETEPTKISEIPLDENRSLTSDEKFQVAFNAMARSFDDEFHKQQSGDSSVDFDLWTMWDSCDLDKLRAQLEGYIRSGDLKGAQSLIVYLWYQENVEKTNSFQPTVLTNQ